MAMLSVPVVPMGSGLVLSLPVLVCIIIPLDCFYLYILPICFIVYLLVHFILHLLYCLLACLFVVVTCGDPGTPSNGARELANQNFGTTVTYTCNQGYRLVGSSQRVCLVSGAWSSQLPECQSKYF